jgi:hypothetical protein
MAEDSQSVTETTDVAAQTTDVAEPVEQQTTEVESQTTDETTEATEETEVQADGETETSEVQDELAPKSQNRFQKLANENRDLRAKLAELEALKVPTEQDYLDGGYDPVEAKLNALEANYNRDRQVEQVLQLNQAIDQDMNRIVTDYPQLNPKSPEFNKELAMSLFQQYDTDSGAQYTDDGITLNTNQLPYNYIKSKMELVELAAAKAKVQAQKDVESMVAAADTPTSKAPPAVDAKDKSTKDLEKELGIVYQ